METLACVDCVQTGGAAGMLVCVDCVQTGGAVGTLVCVDCVQTGGAVETLVCVHCVQTGGAVGTLVCVDCVQTGGATVGMEGDSMKRVGGTGSEERSVCLALKITSSTNRFKSASSSSSSFSFFWDGPWSSNTWSRLEHNFSYLLILLFRYWSKEEIDVKYLEFRSQKIKSLASFSFWKFSSFWLNWTASTSLFSCGWSSSLLDSLWRPPFSPDCPTLLSPPTRLRKLRNRDRFPVTTDWSLFLILVHSSRSTGILDPPCVVQRKRQTMTHHTTR